MVEYWRPIIWSAVIGGAVAALGVQLLLTLFGVGIGAAMVLPFTDASDNAGSVGITAAIYTIVTGIISFGLGGYVAGHMSGVLRTGTGALHGVLAWAAAAVFGGTMAAMAGSATLGGAATGAGAALGAHAPYSQTAARGGIADAPRLDRTTGDESRATESEARAAAEAAARTVMQIALVTAVAFLLSAVAGGVGGTLGRNGQLRTSKGPGSMPTPSRQAVA